MWHRSLSEEANECNAEEEEQVVVVVVGAKLGTILLEVGCFAWVGDELQCSRAEGKVHSPQTMIIP